MTILDRICLTVTALYAMAAVATGCLLTYAPDPISHRLGSAHDGMTWLWVGYALCLMTGLLYWQALTRDRPTLLVNGKPYPVTRTVTRHRTR